MNDTISSHLLDMLNRYSTETPLLRSLADTPEQMRYFVTDGGRAIECWRSLRSITNQTGLSPVILGSDKEFGPLVEGLLRNYKRNVDVASILKEANGIDAQAWLREELAKNDVEDEPWDTTEGESALRGEWPEDITPEAMFVLPFDGLKRMPYDKVMIGLIPTPISWHLPAYLRFGAYNSCPSPAEHVSVLRRWCDQFDAEIVGISRDVIEAQVGSPPTDRDRAIALAYEQFAYCPDIVDQGVGTLDALAATLLNGTVWYFWWD
jgi:hypothetical protein